MKDSTKFKILHWIQFKVLKYNPPINPYDKHERKIKLVGWNGILDQKLMDSELYPEIIYRNIAQELHKQGLVRISEEKKEYTYHDQVKAEYKVRAQLKVIEP